VTLGQTMIAGETVIALIGQGRTGPRAVVE
jgi:hypothetical protein